MSEVTDSTYSQIEWTEKDRFTHEYVWAMRKLVVKLLLSLSDSIEWLDRDKNTNSFNHIPYKYFIDGMVVEFLPHWDRYKIEQTVLMLPDSKEDVYTVIKYMKMLRFYEYKPTNTN